MRVKSTMASPCISYVMHKVIGMHWNRDSWLELSVLVLCPNEVWSVTLEFFENCRPSRFVLWCMSRRHRTGHVSRRCRRIKRRAWLHRCASWRITWIASSAWNVSLRPKPVQGPWVKTNITKVDSVAMMASRLRFLWLIKIPLNSLLNFRTYKMHSL